MKTCRSLPDGRPGRHRAQPAGVPGRITSGQILEDPPWVGREDLASIQDAVWFPGGRTMREIGFAAQDERRGVGRAALELRTPTPHAHIHSEFAQR